MTKVRVYYNLHKKIWSLQGSNGRVLCHQKSALLNMVKLVVRQGGRKKVLETKKKNVHAFAHGMYLGCAEPDLLGKGWVEVSYNPYRNPAEPGTFYVKATGEPIGEAKWVMLTEDRKMYAAV